MEINWKIENISSDDTKIARRVHVRYWVTGYETHFISTMFSVEPDQIITDVIKSKAPIAALEKNVEIASAGLEGSFMKEEDAGQQELLLG
jgi:lipopolysaccharide biosynthesis protein